MTRYDIAKRNEKALREISAAGLKISDARGLAIYEDIMRLSREGFKMTYCVYYASERYGMSEPNVWRLIQHFRTEVDVVAAAIAE